MKINKNIISFKLLILPLLFLFSFMFVNSVSASQIFNEYNSNWGDYVDAQGYRHQQGYSFPVSSIADWIPLGTNGHQAYTGQLTYSTSNAAPLGDPWNPYISHQYVICLEGGGNAPVCVVEGFSQGETYVQSNIGNLTLGTDDRRMFDAIGISASYFCTDNNYGDCTSGGGFTNYYMNGYGRKTTIDSFSPPDGTNININTGFPVSWTTDFATGVNVSSGGNISCNKNGAVGLDDSMTCTTGGSAGSGYINLVAQGPGDGGGVPATRNINITTVAPPYVPPTYTPPPPPGAPPPPSTCTDPAATNNGGALPCVYNACTDGATAYFTSFPTTLTPGQVGSFTVRVTSSGTAKWYHGNVYRFVQLSGLTIVSTAPSNVAGVTYGHLPGGINNGDVIDWTFNVTAPSTPGPYSLQMRMVHYAGADYLNSAGAFCAPAPSTDSYFGQTATANFTVANPTVTTNAQISSSLVKPDGATNYNIVITGTNSAGASRLDKLDFIINYQGTNGDMTQPKGRGAAKYSPTNIYTNTTTYPTASGFKDHRACTGAGGSAVIWPTFGPSYISLVSCSATDISATARAVTYVVRFNPVFTSPTTLNDISSFAQDTVTAVNTSWVNNDTNFGLSFTAPTVTYTCGSPLGPTCSVSAGGTVPLNWTSTNTTSCTRDGVAVGTSGSATSGAINSNTVSTLICTGLGGTSQDSVSISLIAPQTHLLSVTSNPGPGGTVNSVDGFINCGSTCSALYNEGSNVTLTATPASSYWRFSGWSGGGCSGTGQCIISNISTPVTVNATFNLRSFNYTEF